MPAFDSLRAALASILAILSFLPFFLPFHSFLPLVIRTWKPQVMGVPVLRMGIACHALCASPPSVLKPPHVTTSMNSFMKMLFFRCMPLLVTVSMTTGSRERPSGGLTPTANTRTVPSRSSAPCGSAAPSQPRPPSDGCDAVRNTPDAPDGSKSAARPPPTRMYPSGSSATMSSPTGPAASTTLTSKTSSGSWMAIALEVNVYASPSPWHAALTTHALPSGNDAVSRQSGAFSSMSQNPPPPTIFHPSGTSARTSLGASSFSSLVAAKMFVSSLNSASAS
mmetsp:Transcript_6294/g.22391  ORF Transcript_6294/g.22391 Transcript_6294/m.22391 type:complete len:280 (+) Transcript_6294:198-1037(+)